MEQLIDAFCEDRRSIKKLSANSLSAYKNDLNKLFVYLENSNGTSVLHATETQLNSFILASERDGLKPTSIVRLISTIHQFFSFLNKKGYRSDDPSERIKAPKAEQTSTESITTEEMEQLLAAPAGDSAHALRDKAMLELLYSTGIRLESLLSLKLSQINLTAGILAVFEGNAERIVPIGKPAMNALKTYLLQGRNVFQKENSDADLVFYNRFGDAMTRQGFYKLLTEYAKSIGLTNVSPRVLRNSMIRHMMENGGSYALVHQLMGSRHLAAAQSFQKQSQSVKELYRTTHPRA